MSHLAVKDVPLTPAGWLHQVAAPAVGWPMRPHPRILSGGDVNDLSLLGVADMERTLETARTIAVLGIKPESRRHLDAHQIPLYLQKVGYLVLPVPTRYPEATHILGVPVRRSLVELPSPIDVLNVFCKPPDFLPHLADVLVLRPSVVWFQSGLLEPEAARRLLDAGIAVAEDCIGCRRASMSPSLEPFEAQRGDAGSRSP
jgi:predicted CoA-binding protein